MKIAIDPGHNVNRDSGAAGILNENEINLEVANYLISFLQKAGHQVINCLPSKAISLTHSLKQRVEIANQANANMFISIHHNASLSKKAHGAEIYVQSLAGQGLAIPILKEICQLGFANRGVKRSSLYVLRHTKMPAMLIEGCFVDNDRDARLFKAEDEAKAIFTGITGKPVVAEEFKTPATLIIHTQTFLKPSTDQSIDIGQEFLNTFSVGRYNLKDFNSLEESHYEIELGDGRTGFVFGGHCQIEEFS